MDDKQLLGSFTFGEAESPSTPEEPSLLSKLPKWLQEIVVSPDLGISPTPMLLGAWAPMTSGIRGLRGRAAFDEAVKQMQSRYPKLMKIPKEFTYMADNSWKDLITDFVHGSYDPYVRRVDVTSIPNKFGVDDYVHVLAHEIKHAAQTRNVSNVNKFMEAYTKYKYAKNPYEKAAYATGDRVREVFRSLMGNLGKE